MGMCFFLVNRHGFVLMILKVSFFRGLVLEYWKISYGFVSFMIGILVGVAFDCIHLGFQTWVCVDDTSKNSF